VIAMADIIVSIDGKTNPEEIANDVLEKVNEAAQKAVMTAAQQHIKMARENVMYGYRLGYPKVSLMYAWSLIPKVISMTQTADENLRMAEQIRQEKDGMVMTGKLLDGISVGTLTNEKHMVSVELISSAPYSKNLEWGILFGDIREGKGRKFMTGPLQLHTIPTMIKEFKKNLGEIR
jgi:hypothetical protein